MEIKIETKKINDVLKKISEKSSFSGKQQANEIFIRATEDNAEIENKTSSLKESLNNKENSLTIKKVGEVSIKNNLFIELLLLVTDKIVNIYTIDEQKIAIKSTNFFYELFLNEKRNFKKLELINISKSFLSGKIRANDNISLSFLPGQVHSIIGENGSGKSTLMSILFGLYNHDGGEIKINDEVVNMYHQGAARKHKIGMVHQHFHLVDRFTVLENIILGQEKRFEKGFLRTLDKKAALEYFAELSEKYGINLDPNKIVWKLTVGDRQKVEILKVLWEHKDVIVLDEPTATLSVREIDLLLEIVRNLRKSGVSVIFISHKLKEVNEISDTVSILRKGKLIGTFKNDKNLTLKKISSLMVGKDIELKFDLPQPKNNILLKVEDLHYIYDDGYEALKGVSFDIKEGEIFGLAGIEENGQEEIINTISGLYKPTKKSKIIWTDKKVSTDENNKERVNVDVKQISNLKMKERLKFVSHIPIDRFKHGIVAQETIMFNSFLTSFKDKNFSKLYVKNKNIILNKKSINEWTHQLIKLTNVEGADNIFSLIKDLSGGNQQKFVVAREVARPHSLLIAGHPTRGLDINAINNIYGNIIKNSVGKATLLYSLELPELMEVCHRIAILYRGKIVKIINPKDYKLQDVAKMLVGGSYE